MYVIYKSWMPGVLHIYTTRMSRSEEEEDPKPKARGISIPKLPMTENEGHMCAQYTWQPWFI